MVCRVLFCLSIITTICFYGIECNSNALNHIFSYSISEIFKHPILCMFGLFAAFCGNGKLKKLDRNIGWMIICILSAVVLYLGKSYSELGNWNLLFFNNTTVILGIIICCMVGFTLYAVISILLPLIYNADLFCDDKNALLEDTNRLYYKRLVMLTSFGISCVYIIIFYPGAITHDGYMQLTYFYGLNPLTNHFPVLSTYFEGTIVNIGRYFKNLNFGIFLYVMLQSALQAYIYSEVFEFLCKCHFKFIYIKICMAFLLFHPGLQIWGITFVKDTLYYLFFLLFSIVVIEFLEVLEFAKPNGLQQRNISKEHWAKLIISSLFIVFFRSNGFYVIVPCLLLLVYYFYKNNIPDYRFLFIVSAVIGILFMESFKIYDRYGIYTPVEEAMAVQFQQIARVKWSGAQIDLEDEVVLNKLFNNKNLKDLYNPDCADPVKFSFIWGIENRTQLMPIYFKYLRRYPDIYVQAFLNQNYGYYYPFKLAVDTGAYSIPKADYLHQDVIKVTRKKTFEKVRRFMERTALILPKIPFLGIFYNLSLYVWGIIILSYMLLTENKKHCLIAFVPSILSIGVCLVSPVNACFRYMTPVIVTFPVLLLWGILQINKCRNGD